MYALGIEPVAIQRKLAEPALVPSAAVTAAAKPVAPEPAISRSRAAR
jgi:hypothetical protein